MFLGWLDGFVGHVAVGGGVVGIGAVVAVDSHDAITLIGVEGADGLVDGDLLVVDAQTVAMGVGVGEETGLEHRIRRRLHAWDHMRRGEGDLFNLGKVIFWVLVEAKSTEWSEGDIFLRPDFGEVEDVPAEFFSLFGREDLEVACPAWVFALLNAVEEILGMPVGVFGSHVTGFGVGEGLAALIGLAVNLDVVERTVRLGEFVGVARVAVHMTVRRWSSSIGEEMHNLMGRLLMGGEVVPEPYVC